MSEAKPVSATKNQPDRSRVLTFCGQKLLKEIDRLS
jgi:hypothetical protein